MSTTPHPAATPEPPASEAVPSRRAETRRPRGAAAPEDDEGVLRTIAQTNAYIAANHGRANMFATMFLAVLEPASGRLVYVNAGHEPPAVIGVAGVRAGLEPTGPAVGMLPDLEFQVARAELSSGETLFAFTDGATDARAADGTRLGEDRLLALLPAPGSAASLLDRVTRALEGHTAGGETYDDISLLAVHRTAS